MIKFEVKTEAMMKALGQFADSLEDASAKAVDDGMEAARKEARLVLGIVTKRQTGELTEKIIPVRISKSKGQLFFLAKHAAYIEYGTGPGRIYPKRGEFLRFVIDGVVFFRRSVKPIKAHPFVATSANVGERAVAESLLTSVAQLAKKI